MGTHATSSKGLLLSFALSAMCHAQGLAPRAYIIAPLGGRAVTLTYSRFDGNISLEGGFPVSIAGRINVPTLSYFHAFAFAGRSASITVQLPYGMGNYNAQAEQHTASAYRSGFLDSAYRLSFNIKGGP